MTHSITSDINLNKTILIEVLLKRKPILLIDDKEESKQAIEFLINNHIEYVVLHLKKFEEKLPARNFQPQEPRHCLLLKASLKI